MKNKNPIDQIHIWDESIENSFRESNNRRFSMSKNAKMITGLCIALIVMILISVLFRYDFVHSPITAARYLSEVEVRLSNLWSFLTGKGAINSINFAIYTSVIVVLVGAALSVCGAVCQGLYHTPMASPNMLGINSGGMLAAILFLFICYDDTTFEQYYSFDEYTNLLDTLNLYQLYAQQIWMIIGCLLGALTVIFLSTRAGRGKMSTVVLILSGSLLGSFSSTVVSLGQYYFTYVDTTTTRTYAMMSIAAGTFANTYSLTHLFMLGIPIIICLVILFMMAPGINTLMFGDETAKSMGMNVNRFRTGAFAVCVIACGLILSFVGQIGFVGLIVPHFARRFAGSDYRHMLPVCAALGGMTMLLIYLVAVCTGFTTNINFITSIVGGALFIFFIVKFRRSRNADWA